MAKLMGISVVSNNKFMQNFSNLNISRHLSTSQATHEAKTCLFELFFRKNIYCCCWGTPPPPTLWCWASCVCRSPISKLKEGGNQNMKERRDVNNIMCEQMQVSSAVQGGDAEITNSTNAGNMTWWERQCYDCCSSARLSWGTKWDQRERARLSYKLRLRPLWAYVEYSQSCVLHIELKSQSSKMRAEQPPVGRRSAVIKIRHQNITDWSQPSGLNLTGSAHACHLYPGWFEGALVLHMSLLITGGNFSGGKFTFSVTVRALERWQRQRLLQISFNKKFVWILINHGCVGMPSKSAGKVLIGFNIFLEITGLRAIIEQQLSWHSLNWCRRFLFGSQK